MNIVEPIFTQARNKPAEIAIAAPGTEFNIISYGRLARLINSVCHHVIKMGIAPRSRVAVFIEDPILHAVVLLALTRLGVVTLSGRNRNFSWQFTVDAVIADKAFPHPVDRSLLFELGWTGGDDRPIDDKHVHRAAGGDACRIMLTSGTTGEEKAVLVTNRMLGTRIDRQNMFFGKEAAFCARTFCDLALSTSLGFQVLIATLWRGGALFMTGEAQQTVSALPIYKVQNMVGSPGGARALLLAAEKRPEYQCDLQAIFLAGSMLTPTLSDQIRTRLCTNLVKGYGSTEATMVASMPAHFAPELPLAVGRILPGIDVEIVDDNDAALPSGEEGTIRIRSAYGVTGYLDDAEETARAFHDGWFYPGDVGYVTPTNLLIVSGRTRSVINIGGEKISPERIEEILSAHPSVQESAVLSMPDAGGLNSVWAVVVPRSAIVPQILQGYCRERLPAKFIPSRFIPVADLPKNEWGKIERLKLPDLVRSKTH